MPKLLSSTALALALAAPVWAQAAQNPMAVPNSDMACPPHETRPGTVLAQTADTPEATEEELIPDVTDSQPGVTTGDQTEEDTEDGVQTGTTGGADQGGADQGGANGETAEGGMGNADTGNGNDNGAGKGGAGGGEDTGEGGAGSGGASGGAGDSGGGSSD